MDVEVEIKRWRAKLDKSGILGPLEEATAGGLAFYASTLVVQSVGVVTRTSGSSLFGRTLALAGLVGASLASIWTADAWKRKGQIRPIHSILGKNDWERLVNVAGVSLTGIVCFSVLGGRLRSLLPSEFIRPGAFSRRRHALPTGTNYADAGEKAKIDALGGKFGCHTCGNKRSGKYIADHMPPNRYAKEMNERWYRKMFGTRFQVKQHFYPQCSPCSQIQSHVVKVDDNSRRILKSHFLQFRKYHLSGLAVVPMYTLVWLPFTHSVSFLS